VNRKPYLIEVQVAREKIVDFNEYPFDIPAIRNLSSIRFHEDVTFFVGENGAGKSTLIEAIALSLGFGLEGGTRNVQFNNTSKLVDYLKLIRGYKSPDDYYFLRTESFYNVATYMEQTGYLKGYGGSPHTRSHGESILAVLTKKLQGNGLYIFDEPEAALSPARQLTALASINQLVQKKSQLIIATHSPILLAYPRAVIYQLDENGIREISYQDTSQYQITKGFLNDYERMLNILLED
jgi:predicted ATPase